MDRHDTIYKEVKFYTAVLSTIISGYSIFSALREQSKINTLRNRISLVESRPVYTPTTLMAELKSSYPEVTRFLHRETLRPSEILRENSQATEEMCSWRGMWGCLRERRP